MKKGKHQTSDNPFYQQHAETENAEVFAYQNNEHYLKKEKQRRRGCAVVLITMAIILLMLITAGVVFFVKFVKSPTIRINSGKNSSSTVSGKEKDPEQEISEQGQAISFSDGEHKEDCFTLLVVGLDNSEKLTDTIVVATFDVKNKTAAVLNIPRDTVSSYNGGRIHKINSAYGSGGIERTMAEIENVIGFGIDRHVIVTYEAFKKLIDEIGGIDVYVPKDMYKNTGDMIIDLKEGEQHLDGEHALMYMRFRGYANADLARIEAQQVVYQKVIEKIAKPSTILRLPALASLVLENVETDLTVGEMIWIGLNYASMDTETMVYNTLPNTPRYINDISYVVPREAQILELVNRYYNPYTEAITSLNLTPVPEESTSDRTVQDADDEEGEYDEDYDEDYDESLEEDPFDEYDGELDYPDEGEGEDEGGFFPPFWYDNPEYQIETE